MCRFANGIQYLYFTVNAPFSSISRGWEINFIDFVDGFGLEIDLFPQASFDIFPLPECYQS